ncbi:MAG: hypothetical protein Q8O83_01530 [bacterium]|nr:hypothetical protein [bacterium]
MELFLNFVLFFNLLGVLLSFMALTIVAHAAGAVVGHIRSGLLSFLWGLSLILVSFLYSIFYVYEPTSPDLQSFILALGMVLILFSTKKLFSLYQPAN